MHRNKLLAFIFGAAGVAPVTSSLCASIEDEGAAGGGGGAPISDQPAVNVGAPSVAAPAPAGTSERTFTQGDLDRIVADRLARDRATRGGATSAQQPAAAPAAQTGNLTLAQRQERIEQETAFYRGLSRTGVAVTEEQEADLFELFRIQRPERPGEWLTKKIAAFGIGAKPQPPASPAPAAPTNPAAPAAASTPPAAPAAAGNAAPNGVDPIAPGGLVDVSRLTQAQIAQLGPAGVREAIESVLASGRGRDGRPALPAALRAPRKA